MIFPVNYQAMAKQDASTDSRAGGKVASRQSWRPSIRMLIGLIVVSPIIVVSVILATLSWRANARISANLGDQVMSGASDTVAAQVREYLGDVMSVSDRYARRI